MSYITLKFLETEFQIPDDLKVYLGFEKNFTPLITKIINNVTKTIGGHSNCSPSDIIGLRINNDLTKYNNMIDHFAEVLVKELVKRGLYDVTVDNITDEGHHKQLLLNLAGKVTAECLKKGQPLLIEQQLNINSAHNYYANQITGTGIDIITNSFSVLTLYSIVEYNTLFSQAKKADVEYQQTIGKIKQHTLDTLDRICEEVLTEIYYPSLFAVFSDFVNHTILNREFILVLTYWNVNLITVNAEHKRHTILVLTYWNVNVCILNNTVYS